MKALPLPTPEDVTELPPPATMPEGCEQAEAFLWKHNGMRVLRSVDGGLLHISCSYPDRAPTWEEIKKVRYAFAPDELYMGMVLPPKAEYVNVHPYTFHLWQL